MAEYATLDGIRVLVHPIAMTPLALGNLLHARRIVRQNVPELIERDRALMERARANYADYARQDCVRWQCILNGRELALAIAAGTI